MPYLEPGLLEFPWTDLFAYVKTVLDSVVGALNMLLPAKPSTASSAIVQNSQTNATHRAGTWRTGLTGNT